MATVPLEVADRIDPRDLAHIRQGLLAHNAPFLGPGDHRPLAVIARDADTLRGGLLGQTARGWLNIDLLWVAPAERGSGLGSRLLNEAETEARARGCGGAWVDTYDFQARPFYEKQGYHLFAELDGFTNGHRRFFLRKSLA
jgi:GNAT superfamily N-acetyltransferase